MIPLLVEGHSACRKTQWLGAGLVICLEQGADLHMAQLMPLPLTVSCLSKIQIGCTKCTFLVPAYSGSPGTRAVKRVFVYASSSVSVGCLAKAKVYDQSKSSENVRYGTVLPFWNCVKEGREMGKWCRSHVCLCGRVTVCNFTVAASATLVT